MSKLDIDQRIIEAVQKTMFHTKDGVVFEYAAEPVKQLITDILNEVVPEEVEITGSGYINFEKGAKFALSFINIKRKELGI